MSMSNKAPEKIYVKITHPILDKYTEIIAFEHGDGVEYTRTDAFIEKACEFLAGNMKCDGYTLQTKAKFIREFRNYMKGE